MSSPARKQEAVKLNLIRLIKTDYAAQYDYKQESARRRRLLAVPRILANPSLHAVIMIRFALAGPRPLFFLWRNILIAKHSIDVAPGCEIGPGLKLPHPIGVVLASGVKVGSDVKLFQHVTLGVVRPPTFFGQKSEVPQLGDHVTVYANSVVTGSITLGDSAMIGANSFVNRDVAAGEVFRRGGSA